MQRQMLRIKLTAACLALAALPAIAEQRAACAVDAIDGPDASLWAQGVWRPLEVGAAVPRDAIVLTGEETRARIECADGLELTIGVATQINLETVANRREGRTAQLIKGVLGVFSPRVARKAFAIRTPTAVATVGGASALAQVDESSGDAVFVRDGEADVRTAGGQSATLSAGEGVSIDPTGAAGPVKVWGEARIRSATDALGFDWRQPG